MKRKPKDANDSVASRCYVGGREHLTHAAKGLRGFPEREQHDRTNRERHLSRASQHLWGANNRLGPGRHPEPSNDSRTCDVTATPDRRAADEKAQTGTAIKPTEDGGPSPATGVGTLRDGTEPLQQQPKDRPGGMRLGHTALPQLEDRSGGGTHLGHAALSPPDFRDRVRQRGDARQNRQPTHRPPEAALATLLRPEDRPRGTCRGHTSDKRSRGTKIYQKKTV